MNLQANQLYYLECSKKYTPQDITIYWCNDIDEYACDPRRRELYVPKPVSNFKLYAYLHECGHIVYEHKDRSQAISFFEWQATNYAIQAMQSFGIKVMNKTLQFAKYALAEYAYYDQVRGYAPVGEVQSFIDNTVLSTKSINDIKRHCLNEEFANVLLSII